MDILEIMEARHSVRQYNGKEIESGIRKNLARLVNECNRESGLNIQIIFDEPKCFGSMMAHYGKFSGVNNYTNSTLNQEENMLKCKYELQ